MGGSPDRRRLTYFFLTTFDAPAAAGLDVFVKVFITIVVGEFFADFDRAECEHKNASAIKFYFAVGRARMVDVTRCVGTCPAVKHSGTARRKEIFASARVLLGIREYAAGVLD